MLLPTVPVPTVPALAQGVARSALRLADAAGKPLATLEPRASGIALRDGGGRALGEARIEADRVKLRDDKGVERWKIKRKDYGAEIEDAAGQCLYRIRGRRAGEWELQGRRQGGARAR